MNGHVSMPLVLGICENPNSPYFGTAAHKGLPPGSLGGMRSPMEYHRMSHPTSKNGPWNTGEANIYSNGRPFQEHPYHYMGYRNQTNISAEEGVKASFQQQYVGSRLHFHERAVPTETGYGERAQRGEDSSHQNLSPRPPTASSRGHSVSPLDNAQSSTELIQERCKRNDRNVHTVIRIINVPMVYVFTNAKSTQMKVEAHQRLLHLLTDVLPSSTNIEGVQGKHRSYLTCTPECLVFPGIYPMANA
ncbi:hypothetical protein GQ43DRAFT_435425 [Delitschia confertaspora ATCC 74209]|uniref:Uncharacterized protein n=1 Tax=Delitschia confertaspora ATCC 74209 TaxID=1513339 RepID=A0A9P4JFS7_9PLEO|nr:hypothetical protein GQ43DRAFT_435425 [Delitschia confertaspora ATCC 74209]